MDIKIVSSLLKKENSCANEFKDKEGELSIPSLKSNAKNNIAGLTFSVFGDESDNILS